MNAIRKGDGSSGPTIRYLPIWDEIVDGKGEVWDRLFVEKATAVADEKLAAWVRFPLRECLITCLGQPTGH